MSALPAFHIEASPGPTLSKAVVRAAGFLGLNQAALADVLSGAVEPGGRLRALAAAGRPVLLYCAHGERSAMAVETARRAGLSLTYHLKGGLEAWKEAGGEVERAG